jgi:hypothetical protein
VAAWITVPARARATPEDDAPPPKIPRVELRLGAELGKGAFPVLGRLDLGVSLPEHRILAELGGVGAARGFWLEPSLSVRVLGPATHSLWVRGGYQLQHIRLNCYDVSTVPVLDDAHAFDLGLAYRLRGRGGSLFVAEAGPEWLRRAHGFGCSDSGLDARSTGVRLMLLGQWAFRPPFGAFLRAGLRTADHLPEIHVLPELFVGFSFDL